MKTRKIVLVGAICAVAGLIGGCAQLTKMARAKPAEVSPFIEQPQLLMPQEYDFPFHYFYLKKNAGTYDNVYIAPVNIKYLKENKNWAKIDQQLAKKVGSDIDGLAVYMQNAYKKAFAQAKGTNKNLNVVGSPNHEKTLLVETAIISIRPSKAELLILGTAANLFLPGIGVAAGQAAKGSINIECKIKDAKTNEIIAMYANTELDQTAVLNFAGMSWYTSAKHNIDKQADYTARVFSGADYTVLHRKLIKFINL